MLWRKTPLPSYLTRLGIQFSSSSLRTPSCSSVIDRLIGPLSTQKDNKMNSAAAQECPGSNSPCSPPKNSIAPTTTMVSTSHSPSPPYSLPTPPDKSLTIRPLDEERFKGSFKHFCAVKGLAPERELQQVGGTDIKLHLLHQKVIKNRGYDVHEVCVIPRFVPPPNQTLRRNFF